MKTARELTAAATETLAKIHSMASDPAATEEQFEAARADFERLTKEAQDAESRESWLKSVNETKAPRASDLRDPGDADWIPGMKPSEAKSGVLLERGEHGGPIVVPYASKDTEGWIKGYPVAAQHPSILKRLGPDMQREKTLQEEAFSVYFRKGLTYLMKNRADLVPHLRALQENTDSEGGYLVPTDQRFDVIRNPGTPGGVVRPRSTVFTTTRDGGTFPTATSVTWAGIAEEANPADSDPAFNSAPFTIRKSGANNRLSMELLNDSAVAIPALLGTLYGESLGRYEDQQSIEGDGTTEPLGLRVAGPAAVGTVADVTDTWTLAAPTAVEVIAAYFELPAQWRNNASWFMTSSLMARIVQIGSAAAGIHFTELLNGTPGMTLLGRPVFFFDGTGWDDAATISANEELGAFGDFRQYYFIDRMGMTVARDDSVYFATDQIAFKARTRYDSLFSIADAFRILKAASS